MSKPLINIERINQGQPLISPLNNHWESWLTCNPAAVYLKRSIQNDEIIKNILYLKDLNDPKLKDGVVVIHYRELPKEYINFPPSYVGLAVFTPQFELLIRYRYPVLSPDNNPEGFDFTSSEDPRITYIIDTYYMTYCGYTILSSGKGIMSPCYAISKDLVHWTKMGPFKGEVKEPNKDHILFPEKIHDSYFQLHRPCVGNQSDFSIELAMADSIDGEWKNLGKILKAEQDPSMRARWAGGSTVPIPIGDLRYLMIYHTGEWYQNGDRTYYIDVAILNFQNFDPKNPSTIIEKRYEHLMSPETEFEKNAPDDPEHQLNCLFPCGSYLYQNDIYIIYGGANHYVLGAKVNKNELVDFMDKLI